MRDWNTSWVPPPVPGGDQFTSPVAPPADSGSGDWSWLTNDPTSSVTAWHEWLGNVPHELQDFFANFAPTPEQELADAIYKKMGPAAFVPGRLPHAPDPNMHIAQQAAHAAMQSPAYREQLVSSLGWNAKNPHVAFWIQKGGGIPSDPTGTGVDKPPPGGTTTTAAGGTAPSSAIAGSPFDPKAFKGYGYGYQAVLAPQFAGAAGVSNNPGLDVDAPMGTQLNAMFGGTIVAAGFNGPYGNTVLVKMANGFTYRYAHMSALGPGIVVGATVGVGQELGLVGMTGNASGPHVNIEIRDAQGKTIDPTAIIGSLLKGDPSTANKIVGDFASAATGPGTGGGSVKTSDGFLFYAGTPDFNVFVAAATLWRKRYGGDPPGQFVRGLIAAGNTTAEQIQNQMDLMSSDIPNMSWGQRDQLTSDANAAATKMFSRPLPDATVKQLAAEGITTSAQLQLWAQSHPAAAIPNADYQSIYDKTNPQTQKYWDQPPSPDMVAEIHKRMKQGPQQ